MKQIIFLAAFILIACESSNIQRINLPDEDAQEYFTTNIFLVQLKDGTKRCECIFDTDSLMTKSHVEKYAKLKYKENFDSLEIKDIAHFDKFAEANRYCLYSEDINIYKQNPMR